MYRPFVESTSVSFETAVPSLDEFAVRVEKALGGWAWLVAETSAGVAGYAYGTRWRDRPAYARTVETSVYVSAEFQGRGFGRALYHALLEDLTVKGFHTAVAGIALPNGASEALHRALGFEKVGVFRAVGWKFGAWHDVSWWQRPLTAASGS